MLTPDLLNTNWVHTILDVTAISTMHMPCCYDAMFSNNCNSRKGRKVPCKGIYMLRKFWANHFQSHWEKHLKDMVVSEPNGARSEELQATTGGCTKERLPSREEWNAVHIIRCVRNRHLFSTATHALMVWTNRKYFKLILSFPQVTWVSMHWGLWMWWLIWNGPVHTSGLPL